MSRTTIRMPNSPNSQRIFLPRSLDEDEAGELLDRFNDVKQQIRDRNGRETTNADTISILLDIYWHYDEQQPPLDGENT